MSAVDAFTEDAFLGGRIALRQPADGYRAAMDPVLLAAAVPVVNERGRAAGGPVLDLGCGAGAAMLCYAARVPHARLVGLERDPAMADLARANVDANGMADRMDVVCGDIADPPDALPAGGFAQAMANPPFVAALAASRSPHAGRQAANVETADRDLSAWIEALLRAVPVKGGITLIHRADRLTEILARLDGRAGEVSVMPLWPRAGVPAKRVIVQARKGVKGPGRLLPGLVLHGAEKKGQRYTEAAERILRDGEALPL